MSSLSVIAYHTPDAVYSQHAELLAASLKQFAIEYQFLEIEHGSWLEATALKPQVIRRALEETGNAVLYLDIDCVVLEDISPFFSQISEDIAVHTRPHGEMISGTLLFNNTPIVHKLLKRWTELLEVNPAMWDQVALQKILSESEFENLKVYNLSAAYVYIFDLTKEEDPNLSPVIEHLQASREQRHLQKMRTLKYKLLSPFGIFPKSHYRLKARRSRVAELAKTLGVEYAFSFELK